VSAYVFIDAEKANHAVSTLCRTLRVSRSGYYAWSSRDPSPRARQDERLTVEIRAAFREAKGRYGSPRVHQELVRRGTHVGVHRVARLMRANGLKARHGRRFRRPAYVPHREPVAPNLLARRFTADAPNRAWVGDIKYIATGEGWLYLAVLLDLYSRRAVGWHLSPSIDASLTLTALDRALAIRRPPPGLVHHTDRGIQYACGDYQAALRAAGLTCSMSRKGDCWDNAVSESFFATVEKELLHDAVFETHAEAITAIGDYIENFYNRRRLHSTLGYVSPIDFERLTQLIQSA